MAEIRRQRFASLARVFCFFIIAGTAGCRSRPHEPVRTLDESLAVLRSRERTVTSMSAECVVRLDDGHGRRGTLDGAIVATPDAFRIQAWRGHRTILDIIARGDGIWLDGEASEGMSRESRERGGVLPEGIAAAVWDAMSGRTLASDRRDWSVNDNQLVSTDADGPLGSTRVFVDRVILEPVRWEISFQDGSAFELDLADHRAVRGDAGRWPHRVEMQTPQERIELRLREVVLDEVIPAITFQPSRGAVRVGP